MLEIRVKPGEVTVQGFNAQEFFTALELNFG